MAKIKRLSEVRKRLLRKIANPKDHDDPQWTNRMLARVEKRIAKKEKTVEHKQEQRKVGRNRRPQST